MQKDHKVLQEKRRAVPERSSVSCIICQAAYAPARQRGDLMKASPLALESAFMSMCHFCFRCRRPSCPECWDYIHGLCGACTQEGQLPFRTDFLPSMALYLRLYARFSLCVNNGLALPWSASAQVSILPCRSHLLIELPPDLSRSTLKYRPMWALHLSFIHLNARRPREHSMLKILLLRSNSTCTRTCRKENPRCRAPVDFFSGIYPLRGCRSGCDRRSLP